MIFMTDWRMDRLQIRRRIFTWLLKFESSYLLFQEFLKTSSISKFNNSTTSLLMIIYLCRCTLYNVHVLGGMVHWIEFAICFIKYLVNCINWLMLKINCILEWTYEASYYLVVRFGHFKDMLQKSASELHRWLPFVHNHLILLQLDQTEIQHGTFIHICTYYFQCSL